MAWSSELSTSNKYVKYKIGITENSYNVTNNNSGVTVSIKAYRTNTGYTTYGTGTVSCTIDGKSYSGSITSSQKITNSGITLYTKKLTIAHNSDGSKSLKVSASISIPGAGLSSSSQSYTQKLTTIPRKSDLTVSNGTLGVAQTITANRKSSSFTHTLKWTCGSYSGTICEKSSAVSWSFTPALELANEAPNGTQVYCTFTLTTYNGTTSVGSNSVGVWLTIPDSIKPSCNITVTDAMGYADTYGGYVRGLSKAQITVNPVIAYSSSIDKYSIVANGKTYASATATTGILSTAGKNTITATVTDKRNRSGTDTVEISVLDYFKPVVSIKVSRCNGINDGTENISGAFCKVEYSIDVAPLTNQNQYSAQLYYRRYGDTDYTYIPLSVPENNYNPSGDYIFAADDGSTYDVGVSVHDNFLPGDANTKLSTAFVIMHFPPNLRGFGIGKISEKDGLEVGVDSEFYNPVTFRSNTAFNGVSDFQDVASFTGGIDETIRVLNQAGNCDSLYSVAATYYMGNEALNKPIAKNGWLTVKPYSDGSYCYQGFISYNGDKYYRMREEGIWQPWICTSCPVNKVLWSGKYYMSDTQTIDLSEPISNQRHGIVLVWQKYNVSTSATSESDFNYFFVPKYHISVHNSRGVSMLLRHGSHQIILAKYVYVSDTSIKGYAGNASSSVSIHGQTVDNRNQVLTTVLGV